jgi:hypothetical protein
MNDLERESFYQEIVAGLPAHTAETEEQKERDLVDRFLRANRGETRMYLLDALMRGEHRK